MTNGGLPDGHWLLDDFFIGLAALRTHEEPKCHASPDRHSLDLFHVNLFATMMITSYVVTTQPLIFCGIQPPTALAPLALIVVPLTAWPHAKPLRNIYLLAVLGGRAPLALSFSFV